MNKFLRYSLTSLCLMVAYSAIVFTIPFQFSAIFWVAYGFTLVALAGFGVAFWLSEKRGRDARSWFYGFPLIRLGAVLTAVQVVLSVAMMALPFLPVWVGVLEGIVLLGFFAVSMLAIHESRDEILRQEEKLRKNTDTMRALQSKLNPLASQAPEATRPALKKLAENLRYSDPVSSAMTLSADRNLSALISELQAAVVEGDADSIMILCDRTENALVERNRLCKLGKR